VSETLEASPATPFVPPTPRNRVFGLVLTPVSIVVVLLVTWLVVSNSALDSIEARTLNAEYIRTNVLQHLYLSVTAGVIVLVVAVALGIALTRGFGKRIAPQVLALVGIGQAIPAIGLIVLLTILFGIGVRIALIGLIVTTLLPVLRNVVAGLEGVDPALVEAARGMGLRPRQVLTTVELPLAVPVVLAGFRTSLVLSVGVATLATFVNAGGLGDMIVNGIKLQRTPVLITGCVLVCSIAFLLDWLCGLLEMWLRPRGL
jgi:osmoprotectant transport system permease protein